MNRYFSEIINFIPPEIAHFLFLELMKLELIEKKFYSERFSQKIWNINFNNPIGLAAGFDKNAEAISGLLKLGFGYLELGTVTRYNQSGNPKPRIFRIPEFKCIIQRLGFNNKGLENFLTNIKTLENRQNKVLGINIGKNSNSQDYVTDYKELIKACSPYADYIVINISSPNTPGLRDIQKKKNLKNFLAKIVKSNSQKKPILLKISPDLDKDDLDNICQISIRDELLDGIIVSNTTIKREMLKQKPIKNSWKIEEHGGLSGPPLKETSNKLLMEIYKRTKGQIPLIGVGGVSSAEDAFEKISSGASLIQLYTAISYNGPGIIFKILKGLDIILQKKGYKSIKCAIGKKVTI
tara:strand:- start:249 stop:1304 length:1056 start_codon:yes stop_codon:yes gene_type:complete